jgi:hypothetical protein
MLRDGVGFVAALVCSWLIKDVKDEHYIKAELQLVCISMALCVPLYITLSYQTL